jgi:uncharacterized membrane protein
MTVLIVGLVLFLGIHLLPVFRGLRERLLTKWGENGYKGRFSLASAAGLVLIVIGYGMAPAQPRWFDPSVGAMHAARLLVPIALVLIAAANMKSNIRATLKHPMLIGTLLWAGVHLLANGEVRATLLFGGFLVWGGIDLLSSLMRAPVARTWQPAARYDAMAIGGGLVLALLIMTFHRWLFGVAVVAWGL